jgi:Fur family ferric uptake transcriptional regulator
MEYEDFFVEKMRKRDIKPTAIRLLVLRQMFRGNQAVSLPDLEQMLPTVDKSTISRTLSLFLQHQLIHEIDDGSGAMKYAVCDDDCECVLQDEHTHFYCTECHRTFCLKQIHVPAVKLPEGFSIQNINYVIKGLCPECNQRHARRI